MLSFINQFNTTLFIIFTAVYAYQIVFMLVTLLSKKKEFIPKKQHKYAVVIAARNEGEVIAQLLRSIKAQKYPAGLIQTFVIADNCTDNTAQVARDEGAIVFERFNRVQVGKGYALDFFFQNLAARYPDNDYEGFFVFDADNLLDPNYVAEMNKVFDAGYRIITSYRNSKNFDSNWISAGYAISFLRESKYINNARMQLGTSCAVSGTGFLVHRDVIEKNDGWKFNLLTEDIEFSIDSVIKGETIGYCPTAMLYDEQPCTFEQSWNQRLRWSKGFYQVFANYGAKLFHAMFKRKSFSCYDMFVTIVPMLLLTLFSMGLNAWFLFRAVFQIGMSMTMASRLIPVTIGALTAPFLMTYCLLFAFGLVTTITEWHNINAPSRKKIKYLFTYPIFVFSYIPISVTALFKNVEWKPIRHSIVKSVEEVRQ